MSWVFSPEELQAVIMLFEYYADKYAMMFCFPKTLINCYRKKEDIDRIRKSKNIKIAGCEPNFPKEAVHLGLIQCQDNKRTEIVNVRARIKKVTTKLLTMFGYRFTTKLPKSLSLNKLIWNTYIKPTLLTGLNALVVKDEALKELTKFEHTLMRRMFKVRKKASVIPLYDISGFKPIEASIHKQMFLLFYNFWLNPQTPSSKVVKLLLENPNKYHGNYWSTHLWQLCGKYDIPDPLLKEKILKKESWKNYTSNKITRYHHEQN